jgi:restriction endonuclease S subunit
MQYSVVNLSAVKIHPDFRIDADYFEPRYQELERFLFGKKTTELNDFSDFIKKGIFDISPNNYVDEGGIAFLRSGDLKDEFISSDEIIQIAKNSHEKEKKTELVKNDLLMAKVGTIGDVAINLRFEKLNFSQNVMGIKIKKEYKPVSGFLLAFLNCSYGRNQVNRVLSGQVQQKLTLEDIKKVKIVNLADQIQKLVSKIVYEAFTLKEKSKNIYSQAEKLLFSEIGLLGWKPKHELAFVKNFSDAQEAGRIDAEYFQPKYEEIIEAVKKYKGGFDELGNLVKIKDKNFTPKDKEQYKYIELANISSNGEINGYTENLGKELPSRARRKIQKDDLIISSIEGSLDSIALIPGELQNALCSTGFFVIQSENINPETLLILLKIKVGQLQLKRGCKGTILTAINKNELSKIVLPKIDLKTQDKVKQKIAEMYETKKFSKTLLEIAKQGVEMAIEKDEREAENWINSEVEKLGIRY